MCAWAMKYTLRSGAPAGDRKGRAQREDLDAVLDLLAMTELGVPGERK